MFSGNRAEYTITSLGGGSFAVAHANPAGGTPDDGTDTLRNVERARFADQTVTLINRAATGAPAIGDTTPTEGQALTASLAGIADVDGLPAPGGFQYQWQQLNGATWVNVAGATGASFAPVQAQVDHQLRVVVRFVDGGSTTETLVSAATAVVGDRFNGGVGGDNPTLTGGADNASGNGGSDTLSGAAGDDMLDGGAGSDGLNGGGGADSLVGGAGDDTLAGGADGDTLDGGSGRDSMAGGLGDDQYRVDQGNDAVVEAFGEGTDTVLSSVDFSLTANVENLVLTGAAAVNGAGNGLANALTGNGAANQLFGNGGDDTLAGGGGDDLLSGGAGNDVFVFGAGFGNDRVAGFDADPAGGGQDLLDFRALGVTAATFASQVAVTDLGADTRVAFAGGGSVVLLGVGDATAVTASDFILAA